MTRQKLVQAKHVPALPLLRAIKAAEPSRAMIWDLFELPELEGFPPKVLRAKLDQMMLSGLIDGCVCGCRGDFTLKTDGAALLADQATNS